MNILCLLTTIIENANFTERNFIKEHFTTLSASGTQYHFFLTILRITHAGRPMASNLT